MVTLSQSETFREYFHGKADCVVARSGITEDVVLAEVPFMLTFPPKCLMVSEPKPGGPFLASPSRPIQSHVRRPSNLLNFFSSGFVKVASKKLIVSLAKV